MQWRTYEDTESSRCLELCEAASGSEVPQFSESMLMARCAEVARSSCNTRVAPAVLASALPHLDASVYSHRSLIQGYNTW